MGFVEGSNVARRLLCVNVGELPGRDIGTAQDAVTKDIIAAATIRRRDIPLA
jgi:hypothetical protein